MAKNSKKNTKDTSKMEDQVSNTVVITNEGTIVPVKKSKGRPVNPNSPRQLKLKEMAEKREKGLIRPKGRPVNPNSKHAIAIAQREEAIANGTFVPGKRGRHANPNSKRQEKITRIAMAKQNGEYKLGRKTNPNSKRQMRIAEIAAKKASGEFRLGRPKVVKTEAQAPEMVEA